MRPAVLCRLKEVFGKLQGFVSDHILTKGDTSRIRDRPAFRRVFQAAALRALSNTPVEEHEVVLPGSSRRPLTYTHLQANGFLSLQPLQARPGHYQVVMSPATLDVYLKSRLGEVPSPRTECLKMLSGVCWLNNHDLLTLIPGQIIFVWKMSAQLDRPLGKQQWCMVQRRT